MEEVGTKLEPMTLRWTHVTWISLFMDAKEDVDVLAFGSVCRIVVEEFVVHGDATRICNWS